MPKCSRCKTTRRVISLAFKDGKPIFACTKHQGVVPKDAVTDWIRLGKFKKEDK